MKMKMKIEESNQNITRIFTEKTSLLNTSEISKKRLLKTFENIQ